MKIAVDIFGGDNSPSALIDGCVDAAKLYADVEFIFTGDERIITDYMSEKGYGSSRISIIDNMRRAADGRPKPQEELVACKSARACRVKGGGCVCIGGKHGRRACGRNSYSKENQGREASCSCACDAHRERARAAY